METKPKLYRLCQKVAFRVIFENSFKIENCPIDENGDSACNLHIKLMPEIEKDIDSILDDKAAPAYKVGGVGLMLPTCEDCALCSYIIDK